MSKPTSSQIAQRFTQMYIDAYKGDFTLLRDILSTAFLCRNPLRPADGPDAVVALLQAQIDAFADLAFEVRSAFASEEGFAIAYAIKGRHVKPIFGIEPSGKPFTVTGVSLHEVADGRSIGVFSSANFVEVLGALSA